jgi:outer membrane protein assembly factor BamD (BamD/ComL family)
MNSKKFLGGDVNILLIGMAFLLAFNLNAQDKEYKEINSLINSIQNNSTPELTKNSRLYNLSIDFIRRYPTSPLGYYAKSQYYVLSGLNVDSAYFIFKKSSDLYSTLDEKTKVNYCKKFNLCEASVKVYLDTLSFASLRYYSKNQSIFQIKIFLDKYPKGSIAYSQAKELYEKLRYEELSYSNKIKAHEDFLVEFPDSKHYKEISERIEQFAYKEINFSNDTTVYLNYIIKYPKSQYVSEAQLKIVSIKEAIVDNEFLRCSDDLQCLIQFLKNHPEAKQAEQAVKKIIQNANTMFSIGHHLNAINNLKALNALNFPSKKLYNIDSLLYLFEFKTCITYNELENWNKYLASYPDSPFYTISVNKRDSIIFRKIVYSSENGTSVKYKKTLENFINNYPNSIYVFDAEMELKKIGQAEEEKNRVEQSFLNKYATYNNKILRLFVCENIAYSFYNSILPDKRALKQPFEEEIGDISDLYMNKSKEQGFEYLMNIRMDTITKVKLNILQDYGISMENFPMRNTSPSEFWQIFETSESKNLFIRNYVTTSVSTIDSNGFYYVSGFFVNEKHYQKDLDCFVAKINYNESNLDRKVIWLKEFSELLGDGVNLNDWVIELKIEGSQLYVCSLNDKKEYSIYKFSIVGNLEWNKKISEINSDRATINILSNGDLIFFGHSGYENGKMSFVILKNENGVIQKVTKNLANEPRGYLGALITIKNEFVIAINYLEYENGSNRQKSLGRAVALDNSVGFILPNLMLLKYNNNGELVSQKTFKSVEPRVITQGTYSNGTILFKGERGKNNYFDENYISSFFLEIDEKLNVISTDGMD